METSTAVPLVSQCYYSLRDKARQTQTPFYLTIAQFSRIRCSDPRDSRTLEQYVLGLPEGSACPEISTQPGATQLTSKTLLWDLPTTVETEPTAAPAAPAVPAAPAAPVKIDPTGPHPRLIAFFSALRQRVDGSGIPFRISVRDLGEVPHASLGDKFPLRKGLLEMPAHFPPHVTVVSHRLGFSRGNLVWRANGVVN